MRKTGRSVATSPNPSGTTLRLEGTSDPLAVFLASPLMRQVRESPAPLSEIGACTLLLELANEGKLSTSELEEFMGRRVKIDDFQVVDLVRACLKKLVKDSETTNRTPGGYWANEWESGAITVKLAMFGGGELSIDDQNIALTLKAACAYAMCLLLDLKRPFGKSLCQCRAPNCGRFFFEYRGPGARKPTRLYCPDNPACRATAHSLQKSESKRKSRAKTKSRATRSRRR